MTTETDTVATAATEHDEHGFRAALESRALRGTYFVVISYGLAMALRLVSSIIFTHLFVPEYFGLMALLTTIIVGMNLFSHLGLQDSVVQNPRGEEPAFLNTAWTIQVIRGAGLFLITIPAAWPVARFYHEPKMLLLLPVFGFGCLIAAVSSPSLLILARHISVGRLSMLELVTQVVQVVAIIVWAYFQRSIWALAGGRIIAEVVRTTISYFMLPEIRPRFTWDKRSVHEVVRFGKWILIGTAFTFLALQSDRLILAKLISFQMLGIYGIAFALSDIPRQVILQFCSQVGYPFIAKFSHKPRPEYRSIVLKYRMMVLGAGALLLVIVVCTGDLFILHVYDKRYHEAAWMIAIFAVGLWHTMLYSTTAPVLMSLQKTHYNAFAYALYCVTLFTALPLAFHRYGIVGAVIAVAASDLPVYFVNLYAAHAEKVGVLNEDLLMTVGFVLALVAGLTLRSWFGLQFPFPHHLY